MRPGHEDCLVDVTEIRTHDGLVVREDCQCAHEHARPVHALDTSEFRDLSPVIGTKCVCCGMFWNHL